MDSEWKKQEAFRIAGRRKLQREREAARAESQEQGREASLELARVRGGQQLTAIERRHEVSQREKELEIQSEAMLELMRHRLQPEELARLQEDLAIRRTIELQAYERELQVETNSRARLATVAGDEERQTIRATLKARLVEMLAEHKLALKDREHAFGFERQMKEFEASLLGSAGAPISAEEAAQLDAFIEEQVRRQFGQDGGEFMPGVED